MIHFEQGKTVGSTAAGAALEPRPRTWSALLAQPVSDARRAQVQWALAVGLLATQAALLSARFDTAQIAGRPGWWVPLIELLPYAAHGLAFAAAATLVLGFERLRAALPLLAEAPQSGAAALRSAAWSLLGFVLLALGLVAVIERPSAAPLLANLEFLVTLGSGLFWLAMGLQIAAPGAALRAWLARTGPSLALGGLCGLLLFAAARAFERLEFLSEPLSRATLLVAAAIARTFGLNLSSDPVGLVLGTDRFAVIVTRYCSGYEGIGLYLLCTGAFLFLARRRVPLRTALWILPVGALLVWLFNAARIAALLAIGHGWSAELAMEGFHTHAGWLPLIAVSLGSVALAVRHPRLAKSASRDPERPPSNPTAAHLLPLLTLLAVGLLAGAFLTDPRLAAPLRALLGGLMILSGRGRHAALWSQADPRLLWAAPAATAIWIVSAAAQGLLEAPLASEDPSGGLGSLWWLLAGLGYVLVTPIAEELAFRGYLQRRLIERDFELVPQGLLTLLAVLPTVLLFGLLHGNLVGGVLIGALLAWATTWRGRLADAVQLHVAINGALLLAGRALDRPDLWLGPGR